MIDNIINGVVGWLEERILDMFSAVQGIFEDVFDTNMTTFSQIFGIEEISYVIWAIAFSLMFLIVIWQLFRCIAGPMAEAVDEPWKLIVKTGVAMFLMVGFQQIGNVILNFATLPYDAFRDGFDEATNSSGSSLGEILSNAVSPNDDGTSPLISDTDGISTIILTILGLVFFFSLLFEYIKFLMSMAERYAVVGLLLYTSPLAVALMPSKATSSSFNSWCRLFGTQTFILVMNSMFLGMITYAFNNLGSASSEGAAGNAVYLLMMIGFLHVASKFDTYLGLVGLNAAPANMGMDLFNGLRGLSSAKDTISRGAHMAAGGIEGAMQPGGPGQAPGNQYGTSSTTTETVRGGGAGSGSAGAGGAGGQGGGGTGTGSQTPAQNAQDGAAGAPGARSEAKDGTNGAAGGVTPEKGAEAKQGDDGTAGVNGEGAQAPEKGPDNVVAAGAGNDTDGGNEPGSPPETDGGNEPGDGGSAGGEETTNLPSEDAPTPEADGPGSDTGDDEESGEGTPLVNGQPADGEDVFNREDGSENNTNLEGGKAPDPDGTEGTGEQLGTTTDITGSSSTESESESERSGSETTQLDRTASDKTDENGTPYTQISEKGTSRQETSTVTMGSRNTESDTTQQTQSKTQTSRVTTRERTDAAGNSIHYSGWDRVKGAYSGAKYGWKNKETMGQAYARSQKMKDPGPVRVEENSERDEDTRKKIHSSQQDDYLSSEKNSGKIDTERTVNDYTHGRKDL